jgi:hypothetical protein
MSDNSLQNACSQRKFSLLYNKPPTRYEPISPYPEFTSAQIKMKRKVEILKYAKQGTNTRKINQKEKLSQIFKGNYRGNTIVCAEDHLIPVKTSSSDVPGPIVELVEDKNVPLYNYLPNRFANALQINDNQDEWSLFVNSNVFALSGLNILTVISTLLIRKAIKQEIYVYTYVAPVLLNIVGSGLDLNTNGLIMNVNLNNISTKILYGSDEINYNPSITTLDTYDIQITLQPNPLIISGTYTFSANLYLGYMTVSNIYLNTSPGFSFTFNLTYNASKELDFTYIDTSAVSINSTTVLNNTVSSLVTNANDDFNTIENSTINCIINTPPSTKEKTVSFYGI